MRSWVVEWRPKTAGSTTAPRLFASAARRFAHPADLRRRFERSDSRTQHSRPTRLPIARSDMPVTDNAARQVIALIKLGQRAHMEALITRGELYMNPPRFFAEHREDPARADLSEGSSDCVAAEGAKLRVQLRSDEWTEVGTLAGSMFFRDEALARANLYCMHARRGYGLLNLHALELGDSYVMLLNPHEFLLRVVSAAESLGRELSYGLVDYVPRDYTGPLGPFRKPHSYAPQSEFRIVLWGGDDQPCSLVVGDLRDIAIIGDTAEHLRLDPKS